MGIVRLREMLGRKYVAHSLLLCEIHLGSSKWSGHHSIYWVPRENHPTVSTKECVVNFVNYKGIRDIQNRQTIG